MSHLSREQRADLQQALEFKRKQLRVDIREQLIPTERADDGEGTPVPELLNGSNTELLGELIRSLRAVEEAEQRICDSDYGRCQSCGAVIPFERLEVVPEARWCVRCQVMLGEESP